MKFIIIHVFSDKLYAKYKQVLKITNFSK